MPIYTIQIDGRDICTVAAEDVAEADDCMRDEEGFTQYLRATRSDGEPVMKPGSSWSIAEATAEQRDRWEAAVNELIAAGRLRHKGEAEEENFVVFLVAVDPVDSLSL